jgi:hypothetical protein
MLVHYTVARWGGDARFRRSSSARAIPLTDHRSPPPRSPGDNTRRTGSRLPLCGTCPSRLSSKAGCERELTTWVLLSGGVREWAVGWGCMTNKLPLQAIYCMLRLADFTDRDRIDFSSTFPGCSLWFSLHPHYHYYHASGKVGTKWAKGRINHYTVTANVRRNWARVQGIVCVYIFGYVSHCYATRGTCLLTKLYMREKESARHVRVFPVKVHARVYMIDESSGCNLH